MRGSQALNLMRTLGVAFVTLGLVNCATACTFFCAASDQQALFGSNEDWVSTESHVWFVPPVGEEYGRVYFGFALFPGKLEPFNGVNEKGLCFDIGLTSSGARPGPPGGETYRGNIFDKILGECATVDEVVRLLGRYNNLCVEYPTCVVMFGDRLGNSVIVDRGLVGEPSRTRKIVPDDARATEPCQQYLITHRMLSENEDISVDFFRRILAAVHVEETSCVTAYSCVFDLTNGWIHVFYFHDFSNEITIDIGRELRNGARAMQLRSLFPPSIAANDFAETKRREVEERVARRRVNDVPKSQIDRYRGTYLNVQSHSDSLVVEAEGNATYLIADEVRLELFPDSSGRLFLAGVNGDFDFVFAEGQSGAVTELVVESELLGIRVPYQKRP